jgi:hypothetical protein
LKLPLKLMYLDGNEWQNRVGVLRYYLKRLMIATEIPSQIGRCR